MVKLLEFLLLRVDHIFSKQNGLVSVLAFFILAESVDLSIFQNACWLKFNAFRKKHGFFVSTFEGGIDTVMGTLGISSLLSHDLKILLYNEIFQLRMSQEFNRFLCFFHDLQSSPYLANGISVSIFAPVLSMC